MSYDMSYIPASLSKLPGCTMLSCCWKELPLRQSHIHKLPLSPPLASTPSSFTAMQLTMARCCCSML
jgi:hypothetical protein